MSHSIAAIIVSYHTGARLMDSLYAVLTDPDISKVVLVDNGNPVEMRDAVADLAQRYPQLHIVTPEGNLGFGRACNLGANQTAANALLLVNPDAVVKRGTARLMADLAVRLPSPAIVGGHVFGADGREHRGARRRTLTVTRALCAATGLSRVPGLPNPHLENTSRPTAPCEIGAVSGALMLIDRAGFDTLGGFDPAYFLHFEDVDICRRAQAAGGAVWYHPDAGAMHDGASSDVSRAFVERHKARSLVHYVRKFAGGPILRGGAGLAKPGLLAAFTLRAWIVGLLRRD